MSHLYKSWQEDDCPDAHGHTTIRIADGTPNGNTEEQPIATVYDDGSARLIAAAPDLLASLREMFSECAAAMVVIAKHGLCQDYEESLKDHGITNGFGVRASQAIAKATGSEATHGS